MDPLENTSTRDTGGPTGGLSMENEAEGDREVQPLSDPEKRMIQDTWVTVYRDSEDVGVSILLRFFTNFPLARQHFSQFRSMVDPGEMQQSVQLRSHAVRVMDATDAVWASLHDPVCLSSTLESVDRGHVLRRNVELKYFEILNDVILEVLLEGYPQCFTEDVQRAWTKLMDLIYYHVAQTYTQLGRGQPPSAQIV